MLMEKVDIIDDESEMGEFNSDDIIFTTVGRNPLEVVE